MPNTNLIKRKKKSWRNGENGRRRDTYWKNELVFLPWLSPMCFFLIEIWFEGVDLVQIDIIETERDGIEWINCILCSNLFKKILILFSQVPCLGIVRGISFLVGIWLCSSQYPIPCSSCTPPNRSWMDANLQKNKIYVIGCQGKVVLAYFMLLFELKINKISN